jgi:single-stranded-DNA-specific exonuclease
MNVIMAKDWVVKNSGNGNWLENLVKTRGLNLEFDYDQQLHDPFLMKDMDKAVKRLLRMIKNNERLMIFADYDADGVPGAAALTAFFKKIGFGNLVVYLPDRHSEDYGLSLPAIDQAAAEKVKLIITIDCGIANAKEIAYAKKRGIETIVTDHHLVPAERPKAVAVLDPKREDDEYPNKNLCGAGVIFKVIQALVQKLSPRFDLKDAPRSNLGDFPLGWEKWLLDLIAIATVSDMVPLIGENRALVHFGLKVLRRSPRLGIVELCRALRIKQESLTEDDIAFSIGPRINAASRMAHAREAFELLTTEDAAVAATIARRLEKLNKERRKCVDEILATVGNFPSGLGIVSEDPRKIPDSREKTLIVVGHESWSLGVLGLTAARMVEKYRRPVFIWGKNGNGTIKGSCRSDGSVNVVELMRGAGEDFFLNIGGHRHAGGFSLAAEKIEELESRLLAALASLDKSETSAALEIDAELELGQITPAFQRELAKLSPFGSENPKPIFLLRQVEIIEAKKFGNGQAHLELNVKHRMFNKKAISFFNTFGEHNLAPGQKLDLVVSIELSYFRSAPELRLRIVDLRQAG